jgi:hypothetical protein
LPARENHLQCREFRFVTGDDHFAANLEGSTPELCPV